LATQKRKKHPACLLSLRQGKEETLKDFMLRFNREKLTLESANYQTVLLTLWHEVRPDGPLMAKLAKSSTELTVRQFLNKTEHINQEEMIRALMKGQEVDDQVKDSNKKQLPATSTQKGVKS
jgi:hypothetical protein